MTHTEIGQEGGERLAILTSMPLKKAVLSCLERDLKDSTRTPDLLKVLKSNIGKSSPIQYFAEATVAKKLDPEKNAKRRLKDGFITGGYNINLNEIPIWENYVSESRNLRYKMHSWVMLDTLLTADKVSVSDEYLLKAIAISHDWIKKYIISKENDEFAWYDMAVGQRATKLPYLLCRMIEIGESEEKIYHFLIACEIHIVELSQMDRIATHSNHGLFQIAGLITLVKSLPWLSISQQSFSIAVECLDQMLDEHFASDGLHKEHSPEYHLFMINHLSALLDSGWLDSYSGITELTRKVESASHWMQTPDREIIAMGDSKNDLPIIERWHSVSRNLLEGLKHFPEGGLVVHNTKKNGWSQLVFSSHFHSRQHKHSDDQNFTYFSNGRMLLVDAGTYTYQYDLPERIYCESTRAHNTVEIDEMNFSRFRKDRFGTGIKFVAEIGPCAVISSEINHKRLISSFIPNNKIQSTDAIDINVIHRRTLIHYPTRFLIIIDELSSPDEHQYVQWNHIAPELQIREYTHKAFGIHDEDENVIARIYNVITDDKLITPIIKKGETQPHLQGWYSSQGRDLIENTALGFSTFGKNACFATIIDTKLGRTGEPYLRTGSDGKYMRFAITQDGSKVDFKFRYSNENNLEIDAVIDGEQFVTTNIISEEG